MGQAMIKVEGLTMGWDDVILQKDATFTVDRGDVFAILGGSGCGKSTMLRYLIGLETPLEGSIEVAGLGRPRLEVGRPPFGVMFQSGALFGSMTVGENVALSLEQWTDLPQEAIVAIARSKLRLVGLEAAENKMPSELSGGMKKRAAIARALALEPELIFLDEPSAGLDRAHRVELDELILSLNRGLGLTVVLVTHELPSIFKIVSRCVMLDKASRSIIARGDPRHLRDHSNDPRVRQFFNREMGDTVAQSAPLSEVMA
ncbi:MAG: ATP-binding cassette domain-containing protein [Myxococcales bacterium]|nr:MAG: ATP-binding cassette domain-containing protein [Myxococcales bacterium]